MKAKGISVALCAVAFALGACSGDSQPTGPEAGEKMYRGTASDLSQPTAGDDYSGSESLSSLPLYPSAEVAEPIEPGPVVPPEPVTTHPIERFLSTQGTFCADNGYGECALYMRPTANYLGWFNRVYRYSAAVDYAGIASNWLMQNGRWIGTQIRGQVIEESLPDGTTRVTVDLHGDNVLSFVTAGIDFRRPTVFGKQPAALVYPKAQPALGHVDLQATFINVGGGHPLPDLVQLIRQPIGPQRLESLRMVYEGDGLDNYGKPAHVTIMHDESWGPILPSHPASPSSTPPMGMATIALITAQPS